MSTETIIVEYNNQSRNWSSDQQINSFFLRHVHNYARDMIRIRGHVFLNEIFDELGLPRTSDGQLKGWLCIEGEAPEMWKEINQDDSGAITIEFRNLGVIYDKI